MKSFTLYRQHDQMDCGPSCIRMIAKWYGKAYSLHFLKSKSYFSRQGVSLAGISACAESIGFRTMAVKVPFEKLEEDAPLPCIVHWNQQHFVVVYRIKSGKVWIADPAGSKVVLKVKDFLRSWASTQGTGGDMQGIALLMEPTPVFYSDPEDQEEEPKRNFTYLYNYFRSYKRFIWQLILGLLVGSIVQLTLPFLTQAVVDVGINTRNLNFIYIVLAAQLMLFVSRTCVDFIRRWILLHLSTRINIALVSEFLSKIMKVPISFFDSHMVGDIMQRINDHSRVQSFLSTSTLNIVFSAFNLVIFGIILFFYHLPIFLVFLVGSAIYIFYVIQFMKKREHLDYLRFNQQSSNQNTLIQLINGITEIRLYVAETFKRWEWERIQAKLFKINVSSTMLAQWQETGGYFLNELKNIFITILAAKAVIDGEITLGMMLAIQYIIGQLNGPINESISFIRQWQDAKVSFARIGEIHNEENEENEHAVYEMSVPQQHTISFRNVSFGYDSLQEPVLKDLSFDIPEGKVTAIVGSSGSGKTTLLKLLLKFYKPQSGQIKVGDTTDLAMIHSRVWRDRCGAVMQEGYLFSDTIARNIALGFEEIDQKRLREVSEIANILEFVNGMALGFNTKVGNEGIGLSQGQKQRMLIARALYKSPDFVFFDEATSSLDARNEREIMQKLEQFYEGRTVVVIAHRLSTVRNADQILVLDKGEIIEQGDHDHLVALKGSYFHLVKNQLELGN